MPTLPLLLTHQQRHRNYCRIYRPCAHNGLRYCFRQPSDSPYCRLVHLRAPKHGRWAAADFRNRIDGVPMRTRSSHARRVSIGWRTRCHMDCRLVIEDYIAIRFHRELDNWSNYRSAG